MASSFNISSDLNVSGNTIITGNTTIIGNVIFSGSVSSSPSGTTLISPIVISDLSSSSQTNYLVIDGSGNLTYNTSGGGGGGTFTGGNVSGATNFTGGLSANTISATTYFNIPFITGGTYTDGNISFTTNTGFTFTVTGSAPYNAGLVTRSNEWINNNNGTISLPSAYVSLYNQTGFSNTQQVYTISAATSGSGFLPALSNNDTNYIIVEYNSGSPRWNILTDDSTINGTTIVLTHIVYRANNFLHVLDFGNQGIALPNKLNSRVIATNRFARESGFSLGLSGSGVVTLTSGVAWNGTNRQLLNAVASNSGTFFQSFHSGSSWVYTTTATTLNNVYYDTSTDRVFATAGKYLVNWYYRGQEVNDHIYELWGTSQYDSVSDAQLSVEPTPPELITSHAFLVGRIIVLVGATTGSVQSSFVQVFQGTSVTAHNDLSGIQGGSAGQYYHLTSTQYTNNAYINSNNNFTTSQSVNGLLSATTISSPNITGTTISATTYQNLPVSGLTQGTNITITNNGSGNYTINSTGGGSVSLGTVYTTGNNFNFL